MAAHQRSRIGRVRGRQLQLRQVVAQRFAKRAVRRRLRVLQGQGRLTIKLNPILISD